MGQSPFASARAAVRPIDLARAGAAAVERTNQLNKPRGSLGRLESLGTQLAAITQTCPPPLAEPVTVCVFAGGHGVLAHGVSPWPQAIASTTSTDFCDPDAVIGGGESSRDDERMAAALGELCPDRTTIVVSHGDALRYALGWATGKPVEDCGWVEFVPGSVAAVDAATALRWLPTRQQGVRG